MEEFSIGMMAKSLAGHDKGKIYLVSAVDEQYVYLVDGKYRTMEKPKRKKRKHVQIDHRIPLWIENILSGGNQIQDSDVIKVRKDYGRL